MAKRKSVEEYLNEVKDIRPDVELVDSYDGKYKTKWKFNCSTCGEDFHQVLSKLVVGERSCGCNPVKRRTPDGHMRLVNKKLPNLTLIDSYDGKVDTNWKFRCTKCGDTFKQRLLGARNGKKGCSCNFNDRENPMSVEDHMKTVSEALPDVTLVDSNNGTSHVKWTFHCSVCNKDFKQYLQSAKAGSLSCGCSAHYKHSPIDYNLLGRDLCHQSKLTFVKHETTKDGKQFIYYSCPKHGYESRTLVSSLRNRVSKDIKGCATCVRENGTKGRSNTSEFVRKAKSVHGNKYDYSKVEYIRNYDNVIIVCDVHGAFQQTPANHLNGNGCKICSKRVIADSQMKTTEEFIKDAKEIHGDKYDYSQVEYTGAFKKVKIGCKVHGIFKQIADGHLAGKGCNKCGRMVASAAYYKSSYKNQDLTKVYSNVYLMHLVGNIYKIGISNNVENRLKQISLIYPNVTCVFFKKFNAEKTINKEFELHAIFAKQQTHNVRQFAGMTECFELSSNDIIFIKEYLNEVE